MCRRHLAADGAMAVQSTSPYFAPGAFWSIHETLKAAGTRPTPAVINRDGVDEPIKSRQSAHPQVAGPIH